ncbi:AraC family transcriptional regulator [Marinobacterium jannaschii]|uniref:AraC family transcriptional regulator n=1 Tax=Marinobacterium jannaschii TaxID=64970 RepID=UPI00047FF79B|nr:AraC family transcriptional regulator [Marinobacterium jannaschii]
MKNRGMVSTNYVRHLLNQARSQGYDVDSLLQEAGLSSDAIDKRAEFAADTFGQLYQRMMWIAQDEYFGMLGGGKVPNGTFRMMCYSIIHAKTLEKAIYRASDFHEICRGTQVKPLLVRKGRYAKVSIAATSAASLDIDEMLRNEQPERIRTSLSMWHNFICWLIGSRVDLKAVYFGFDEPQDTATYQQIFQSEVRFCQHDSAFVFPAYYLDYPIVHTDDSLRVFLKTAPYQLIVTVNDDRSLTSQVVALLGRDFTREVLSAEEVAGRLNMSVSTLRRRLMEEGSSYQKIKDECRKQAAIEYMNSPQLSINDVASLMGFEEPSAFFRSFKKWTGMTPGSYRKSDEYRARLAGMVADA